MLLTPFKFQGSFRNQSFSCRNFSGIMDTNVLIARIVFLMAPELKPKSVEMRKLLFYICRECGGPLSLEEEG